MVDICLLVATYIGLSELDWLSELFSVNGSSALFKATVVPQSASVATSPRSKSFETAESIGLPMMSMQKDKHIESLNKRIMKTFESKLNLEKITSY